MHTLEFVRKVKEQAKLDNDKEAMELIQAVFRALHQRLPEGEADNIEATLPPELQKAWEGSLSQRLAKKMGIVERFGKPQFINRVQNMARLESLDEAERKSIVVLHVLKEAIPSGEVEDASAQLPPDLREFWLAA